jgi:hypothetical protein
MVFAKILNKQIKNIKILKKFNSIQNFNVEICYVHINIEDIKINFYFSFKMIQIRMVLINGFIFQ